MSVYVNAKLAACLIGFDSSTPPKPVYAATPCPKGVLAVNQQLAPAVLVAPGVFAADNNNDVSGQHVAVFIGIDAISGKPVYAAGVCTVCPSCGSGAAPPDCGLAQCSNTVAQYSFCTITVTGCPAISGTVPVFFSGSGSVNGGGNYSGTPPCSSPVCAGGGSLQLACTCAACGGIDTGKPCTNNTPPVVWQYQACGAYLFSVTGHSRVCSPPSLTLTGTTLVGGNCGFGCGTNLPFTMVFH